MNTPLREEGTPGCLFFMMSASTHSMTRGNLHSSSQGLFLIRVMPGSGGPGVAGKPYHQIVNRLSRGRKFSPWTMAASALMVPYPAYSGSSFGSSVG